MAGGELLLTQAVEAARTISGAEDGSRALAALAPHLPDACGRGGRGDVVTNLKIGPYGIRTYGNNVKHGLALSPPHSRLRSR